MDERKRNTLNTSEDYVFAHSSVFRTHERSGDPHEVVALLVEVFPTRDVVQSVTRHEAEVDVRLSRLGAECAGVLVGLEPEAVRIVGLMAHVEPFGRGPGADHVVDAVDHVARRHAGNLAQLHELAQKIRGPARDVAVQEDHLQPTRLRAVQRDGHGEPVDLHDDLLECHPHVRRPVRLLRSRDPVQACDLLRRLAHDESVLREPGVGHEAPKELVLSAAWLSVHHDDENVVLHVNSGRLSAERA
jgi:hypothetical protein